MWVACILDAPPIGHRGLGPHRAGRRQLLHAPRSPGASQLNRGETYQVSGADAGPSQAPTTIRGR